MSKTIDQIREELDANIPRDAISERDGGGGRKLSYLAGWYVIDRLNKVLGQFNWSYQLMELTKTFEGDINGKPYVSYIAKVNLTACFLDQSAYFTDIGFGDGSDPRNPGKAHELATKEAVTDGIKRCAKSLGMSMGLALYDKTQEYVDEVQDANSDGNKGTAARPEPKTNIAAKDKAAAISSVPNASKSRDAAATRSAIKSSARVLDAQKTLSIADFKAKYLAPLGADKVDALTDLQAESLYNQLKVDRPELKLA